MDMDYNLYKIFLSVASNLSFSKASEEIFLTQSAISQSIQKLEKILKHNLFIREGKRIILSDKGKQLFSYLKNGEHFFKTAYSHLEQEQLNKKVISIACPNTMTKYFLVPLMLKYKKKFPEISFNIYGHSEAKNKIATVENNQNDFAIIEEIDSNLSSNLKSKFFNSITYKLMYNPEFFNFDENTKIEDVFNNHILLQTIGTQARSYFDHVSSSIYPQSFSEFKYSDPLIEAVEYGLGVGFAPIEYIGKRNIKTLDLIFKKVNLLVVYKNYNEELVNSFLE